MKRQEYTRIKEIIVPIAQKHGVKNILFFGSRARGDNNDNSDYDFLISRGKIDTILSHMAFVYDLEDAFGTHVDVVTDDIDDMEFLQKIRRDGIALYDGKG